MNSADGGTASMRLSRRALTSPSACYLRVQHEGRPYRILYAFDPRRTAFLLLGGDKTGNNRWYEEYVPRADTIYDQHLRELETE